MSKTLMIINWLVLANTTVAAALAGVVILQVQSGIIESTGSGLGLMFLISWLGIFGLICLLLGFMGYFRARREKTHTPLVHSLSLVIGALALLMALYFGAL